MKMTIKQFKIIGISIQTTNENNQATIDVPALWDQFLSQNLIEKIPNKIGPEIYCVYTDYEKDHTKPYKVILGCGVANFDKIPEGMIDKKIETRQYQKFIAKGDIKQGAVAQEWIKIWNSNLERRYTTDFEVYGKKAQNLKDAEVEIFVAIN